MHGSLDDASYPWELLVSEVLVANEAYLTEGMAYLRYGLGYLDSFIVSLKFFRGMCRSKLRKEWLVILVGEWDRGWDQAEPILNAKKG